MRYELIAGDTFPLIKVDFEKGETIKAESGAMVATTSNIKVSGKMDGGFGKAFARMFSGESFFLQEMSCEKGAGWALLAAASPGEIRPVQLSDGQTLIVQKKGFLAATPGVEVSTKVQSLTKGILSGEGLFVVKLTGSGTVFLSTYGAMQELTIPAGESLLIDNGHLVAWDSNIQYDITKGAKSWFSSFTSGEGFACRFHGPGKVLIQTRSPQQLGLWLFPFLPRPPAPKR